VWRRGSRVLVVFGVGRCGFVGLEYDGVLREGCGWLFADGRGFMRPYMC